MLSRRLAFALPLLLAGCGGDEPVRRDFPPLHFDFLTPLPLNVASVSLSDPPPPGPLAAQSPVPVIPALQQMARDRLTAGGSAGRAVFVIDRAEIAQVPGGLDGHLAVHLDVLTSEGNRAGFAEASVSRRLTGLRGGLAGGLYDITQQMMADMNVEFEFQVRRSLKDWLQDTTTAPPPPAVERQDLSAPRRQ